MGHLIDADIIFNCLQSNMGSRAVARDASANCVYLEGNGHMPTVHKLNAELGISHCYADLSALLGAEAGPVLELANQINISIARDLGMPISAHVIDDRLHLSDIRPIDDGNDAHRLCTDQARDLFEIAGIVAKELRAAPQQRGPDPYMIRL